MLLYQRPQHAQCRWRWVRSSGTAQLRAAMSCVEHAAVRAPSPWAWPRSAVSSSAHDKDETALLIRTTAGSTSNPSSCLLGLLDVMRRELNGVARMNVLTDLSLWAPPDVGVAELRTYADEHELALRRVLPTGVEPFAFTVAEFIQAWPSVCVSRSRSAPTCVSFVH